MKQIFCVLLILFTISVHAKETLSFSYQANGGGLHLMNAHMNLNVSKSVFVAESSAQTKGLLGVLLDAQTIFKSNGKIENNQFVDLSSSIEALSKNKHKKRQLNFENKPDFVDYQTALFQMMFLPFPQDKIFKVYDGKREMLIHFTYQGDKTLNKIRDLSYEGKADYYSVTIEVISGKKNGWFFNRMNNKQETPLKLFFAKIQDDQPYKALVRASFDTALFGEIIVDMNHYSGELLHD